VLVYVVNVVARRDTGKDILFFMISRYDTLLSPAYGVSRACDTLAE
jgi:hypothetical protein